MLAVEPLRGGPGPRSGRPDNPVYRASAAGRGLSAHPDAAVVDGQGDAASVVVGGRTNVADRFVQLATLCLISPASSAPSRTTSTGLRLAYPHPPWRRSFEVMLLMVE